MKFDTAAYEAKMKKTLDSYAYTLSTLRAGRASADVLSPIKFEYYGAPTPVNTMADVKATDSKTVTITPYDMSTLKAMEKAILASDVGITPTNDGKVIRLVFPELNEGRRKQLAKDVSKLGEEAKVAVRNTRRDVMEHFKKMKKDSLITEDEQRKAEEDAQKLTDKAIKDVDMDNDSFKGIEAIILSMTPKEREHPEIINGSRRKRIADGSGTSLPEVNKLLKQFEGTRKMMKTVMGANMGNMMKNAMRRRR